MNSSRNHYDRIVFPSKIVGQLNCYFQALVEVVQGAFPVRFKGFHILENSIVFNYLYLMTKPFLSRKIKKRILVHGNDVRRLHEHICPSILPEVNLILLYKKRSIESLDGKDENVKGSLAYNTTKMISFSYFSIIPYIQILLLRY